MNGFHTAPSRGASLRFPRGWVLPGERVDRVSQQARTDTTVNRGRRCPKRPNANGQVDEWLYPMAFDGGSNCWQRVTANGGPKLLLTPDSDETSP